MTVRKTLRERTLRPVRPNAGITAAYRRRMNALIDEMQASVLYWLKSAYRNNTPVVAQDELPSEALRIAVRKLARRWQKQFRDAAPKLADYFAQAASQRSDAALKKILRDGGYSVKFTMSRAQQDILRATVNENVNLIKSIPQQYFVQVEGMVMRSVQTGRDLATLTKELQEQFGVTKRRAAFISRDQNNKVTSALQTARQIELGLYEATWLHSGGGKRKRPTHVKMNGKKFDVRKGMYDSHEKAWIQPGQLVNCKCQRRVVLPY